MKILVALPKKTEIRQEQTSIDLLLEGNTPCSGTISSIIRLAEMLYKAGFEVVLSASCKINCSKFNCCQHQDVKAEEFDYLIVHESHWDGIALTFGNQAITKTFLWLHLYSCFALIYTFIKAGGYRVVCPSVDCANAFRAVPGWDKKVVVVYNSYNQIFNPISEDLERTLLFIGAIRPSKGFVELMNIWSELAANQVELKLLIAGSISLHDSNTKTGSIGIGERKFESEYIEPWLKSLPDNYQPNFLGALTPKQLQQKINQSWAVIVNPSWYCTETFCISAVEAQACNKTVFSVAAGGLKETVYRGKFKSLATEKKPSALSKLILNGLSNLETVCENGILAGDYVRNKFSYEAISDTWINLISAPKSQVSLPKTQTTPRDLFCDLMRYSHTGVFYYSYRSPHDRKILNLKKSY